MLMLMQHVDFFPKAYAPSVLNQYRLNLDVTVLPSRWWRGGGVHNEGINVRMFNIGGGKGGKGLGS